MRRLLHDVFAQKLDNVPKKVVVKSLHAPQGSVLKRMADVNITMFGLSRHKTFSTLPLEVKDLLRTML